MEKYLAGSKVYWTDPSGETSGVYTIIELYFDNGEAYDEDAMVLISDGFTEAEVYLHEITPNNKED